MAKSKKEQAIVINKPNFKIINVRIIGTAPLNVHRLGKKLKEEVDARDKNKPIKKKGPRDKDLEFMDSLYFLDSKGNEVDPPKKITKSTKFGFPSSGFKKAMVFAARQYKNITIAELKGRFFVLGQYVVINGKPKKDEFWRRIGGKGPGTGTPDIGVRAVFENWFATLSIRFNEDVISADSIVNLLATAGFSVGIGEDRPDKTGGSFGTWKVA